MQFKGLLVLVLLLFNSNTQAALNECGLDEPYSPERKVLSQEEAHLEYEDKFLNGDHPNTAAEYEATLKENQESLPFDAEEVLSAEELADTIGADIGAEALGEEVGGVFLDILGSIGASYEVFNNPHSTKLDKSAAALGWVPLLGPILGFIDMGIHEAEKQKHRKAAGALAKKLNSQEHYSISEQEQEDLNKLTTAAKNALSAARNDVKQKLTDYYIKSYSHDAQLSIENTGKYYAGKWLKESKAMIGLIDFLKKSLAGESNVIPANYLSHSTRVACGISNDSNIYSIYGKQVANISLKDKSTQEFYVCFDRIFNDYQHHLSRSASASITSFHRPNPVTFLYPPVEKGLFNLVDKYKKMRNHLLANTKLANINRFYEARVHVNETSCGIFKMHSQQFIEDRIIPQMEAVARADFLKANNLDSEGQSRDPACWSNHVICEGPMTSGACAPYGGCSKVEFSSNKACKIYYTEIREPPVPQAQSYICDRIQPDHCPKGNRTPYCSHYCRYPRVYDWWNCDFVIWDSDSDDALKEAKQELYTAVEHEYISCLASPQDSHLDFATALESSDYFRKREIDHDKLFDELFHQAKLIILETLIKDIAQKNTFVDGKLVDHWSNRCLDIEGGRQNVIVWDCHDGDNQKWYWDGERIRSRWNDRCLCNPPINNRRFQ